VKKYLTVLASFVIMLCIGSVYAWSIIASRLIEQYGFYASQSQIIFGVLIGTFPVTMIFVGQLGEKIRYRYLAYISGVLFFSGYFISGSSEGNFLLIVAGIATGFGYWVALTSSVQWFPHKKGLITGIASAGFGVGAVFMSELSEVLLNNGYTILELLKIVGVSYGLIIFFFSNMIYQVSDKEEPVSGSHSGSTVLSGSGSVPVSASRPASLPDLGTSSTVESVVDSVTAKEFVRSKLFKKLFLGIFFGTFAGLLIIGSLGVIGGQYNIVNHIIIIGVALFSIANFLGRLIWGFLSDHIGSTLGIFLALLFQSLSIISLIIFSLTEFSYLVLSFLIGFGFGGNFVLFAKETAQVYGVVNLGKLYPYVFVGYAIAGILGPISGGFLYDFSGSFYFAIILASGMSLSGSLLFLKHSR
jgi:OFA family oxalate/formate antiporter-like MFS transporter